MRTPAKRPLFLPLFIVATMVVVGLGVLLRDQLTPEKDSYDSEKLTVFPIQKEAKVFWGEKNASRFHPDLAGNGTRNAANMESRRAFPGAPPRIPHEIPEDGQTEGQTCLQCHKRGGFVRMYNAFAAVTPHPEFENCRQCHVPNRKGPLFRPTNWVRPKGSGKVGAYLQGSPPPISHTLQLRENCLSCHSGPSSPVAIRTTHPERSNCRQCHAKVDDKSLKMEIFGQKTAEVSP